MTYDFTFTVFTCTYNRAYTLDRVYDSLKAQTFRDFEWLVVDNGSSDNTKELVEKWTQEADFPIRRIFWERNIGFHLAFNRGVQEARGKFFIPFDSDDACVPEALECFKKYWDLIPEDSKDKFSAVSALCVDQNGKLVGTKFPKDVTDSNTLEVKYKYRVKGEKWGFQRTDVLKEFPFPTPDFEGHLMPSTVWIPIARKYQTRFINKALRIYYINEENRSDQITKPAHPGKSARGRAINHQIILNVGIDWFCYSPISFFQSAAFYIRYSCHAGIGLLEQVKKLDNNLAKLLWLVMLPIGGLIFQAERTRFYPLVQKMILYSKR